MSPLKKSHKKATSKGFQTKEQKCTFGSCHEIRNFVLNKIKPTQKPNAHYHHAVLKTQRLVISKYEKLSKQKQPALFCFVLCFHIDQSNGAEF